MRPTRIVNRLREAFFFFPRGHEALERTHLASKQRLVPLISLPQGFI